MKKITMETAKIVTLQDAYSQFMMYNKIRNLSPSTIKYYDNGLSRFIIFYGDINKPVSLITQKIIEDYTLYLQTCNLSSVSVNTYLRAMRTFLKFCMQKDYVDNFIIKSIQAIKPIKEVYTEDELTILLKKPNIKKVTFAQYRNWVMVSFLISTGVRLSSARNIMIKDIDFNSGIIYVRHNKNRKQQILPLNTQLSDILQEYLKHRKGALEDYLFVTQWGNQFSIVGFEQAIYYYNTSLGVSSYSVHKFRHTFAYRYIKAGGDVCRLQKLLGHSSLQITQNYVNLFGEDLKDNFDEYNPLTYFTNKNKHIKI